MMFFIQERLIGCLAKDKFPLVSSIFFLSAFLFFIFKIQMF
ncbi:hypothetical protein OPIT5_19145 [Opitutaceae bacterium TAV5]|nr:hypothetical protein OPIT5_19145 [Opitutaceae bacterium TAV5]